MKALAKILFLFIYLVFVTFFSPQTAEAICAFDGVKESAYDVIVDYENTILASQDKEGFIVVPSNHNCEITSGSEEKNEFVFANSEYFYSQNKIAQFILCAMLYRSCNSTNHKISTYLKNEICVRAP